MMLKFEGKAMVVILSDGEVSDDESECDEDGISLISQLLL